MGRPLDEGVRQHSWPWLEMLEESRIRPVVLSLVMHSKIKLPLHGLRFEKLALEETWISACFNDADLWLVAKAEIARQ